MTDSMVERGGAALRQKCSQIFGTCWDNDVSWRLACAAIAAMREPSDEMCQAASDKPHHQVLAGAFWSAMIDAALSDDPNAPQAQAR